MKKLITLLLLLLPAFSALDVQRTAVHVITPSFEDNAVYADVLFGQLAAEAAGLINATSELSYATTRIPIEISRVSVTYFQDRLVVNASGKHPSFVTRMGGLLALGGTVFEDAACRSTARSVRAVEQEARTKIVIPENWSIISTPPNRTKKLKIIDYNFSAWTEEDGLHQYFYLKINKNASLKDYCAERADAERLFQPFLVLSAARAKASPVDAVILLAITFVLLYGLKYVMRAGE